MTRSLWIISKSFIPSQLTAEKPSRSDHLADYLELTFTLDSGGKLSIYDDKRDDFDLHTINFPFLSSNIPSGSSYLVYISQLVRYAGCWPHYDNFIYRHTCQVDRLLSQGYIEIQSLFLFTWICHLDFSVLKLISSCDGCHA